MDLERLIYQMISAQIDKTSNLEYAAQKKQLIVLKYYYISQLISLDS